MQICNKYLQLIGSDKAALMKLLKPPAKAKRNTPAQQKKRREAAAK